MRKLSDWLISEWLIGDRKGTKLEGRMKLETGKVPRTYMAGVEVFSQGSYA